MISKPMETFVHKGGWWSPEKEHVVLPVANEVVNQVKIQSLLNETQKIAKNPVAVAEIIDKAFENATLKNVKACELKDEFVQGLSLSDVAVLLNCDFKDPVLK